MSKNDKIIDLADIDRRHLMQLIIDNKYQDVKDFLDTIDFKKVDINTIKKNRLNQNFLHLACDVGSKEIATLLYELGENINHVDIENRSPLSYAAVSGSIHTKHSELVEYLCGLPGINVNIVAEGQYLGETALMYAAWKCRLPAVKALVKAHADMNVKRNEDSSTALMYAAYNQFGRKEARSIIKYLIHKGAKDTQNKRGETAMQILERVYPIPISQINPESPMFITPENAVNHYSLSHTPKNSTPKIATPKNATPQRLTPDPPSARPRIHKPRIRTRSRTPRSRTPRSRTPRSHSPKGTPDPSAIQIRNEDPTRRNRTRKLRRF